MQSEIDGPGETDSLKQCISESCEIGRQAIAKRINKKLVICITKNMTMY